MIENKICGFTKIIHKKAIQKDSFFYFYDGATHYWVKWHSYLDTAGRTLERFLLLLTQAGIAHAYLNQPCEVPEINIALRKNFPKENLYPQILLRIGYAKPVAYSKRKDIKEVMR